jgi:acyl phosphate:glycerol-3-phosphate acyltransferase
MGQSNFVILFFILLFAYLLGSVPFGLILVRQFKSIDVRQTGSGNIGATNVRRTAGWKLGIATLICDALKGALPVLITGYFVAKDMPIRNVWLSLSALSAFSGHLFPVYLKFKTGGKGVATAAGCFAVISLSGLAIALLVFILVTGFSKRVSAGSLSAAVVLPIAVMGAEKSLVLAGCAVIISLLIIFRHKDNIRRLMTNTEPPLWGKQVKK